MDEQLKANLTSRRHWTRLLFMVLFAILLQVAALVMWALVAVQFVWALITGSDNDKLRRFGQSLASYIYQALQFLTYNTEHKPFPFDDWPDLPPTEEKVAEVHEVEPAAGAGSGDEIIDETREVVEDVKEDDETGGGAAGEQDRPDTRS